MAQQQQGRYLDIMKVWTPIVVLLLGTLAGYVRLTDAVAQNAEAIKEQAEALQAITQIMLSDTRQEERIATLQRDYELTWETLQAHINKPNAHRVVD